MSQQIEPVPPYTALRRGIENIRADRKENTANRYISCIHRFVWYLDETRDKSIYEATRADLKNMIRTWTGRYETETIRSLMSGVDALYTQLADIEDIPLPEIPESPRKGLEIEHMDGIDDSQTLKDKSIPDSEKWLRSEEMDMLVAHATEPSVRNKTLIRLQYATGLRVGELVTIETRNIDMDDRSIWIPSKYSKSDHDRTVYIMDEQAMTLLRLWLNVERENYGRAEESRFLFPTHRSDHISTTRVGDIYRETAWAVNDDEECPDIQYDYATDGGGSKRYRVSTHIARHSFSMRYLKRGMSYGDLADLLGHSDINTTKDRYSHMLPDETKDKARVYWDADVVR